MGTTEQRRQRGIRNVLAGLTASGKPRKNRILGEINARTIRGPYCITIGDDRKRWDIAITEHDGQIRSRNFMTEDLAMAAIAHYVSQGAQYFPRDETRRPRRAYSVAPGERFGRLLVIGHTKGKNVAAIVRCDCGETVTRSLIHLVNLQEKPATSTTGCTKRCVLQLAHRKHSHLFVSLRSSARARDLELTLTFAEFKSLRESPCCYCGGPLPTSGHGVDRADNAIGYTAGNAVPCCGPCNLAKGSAFTFAEYAAAMVVRVARTGIGQAWDYEASSRAMSERAKRAVEAMRIRRAG